MPNRLNIPNTEDKFEKVSFVHDMTIFQLKVFIKNIFENLHDLSNIMDRRRKDIPKILDKMMDGTKWTKKDVEGRYVYGFYKGFNIRFDTLNKNFVFLNSKNEPVEDPIQGYTSADIKKIKKEQKQNG